MKNGKIGVSTENIFDVVKTSLYASREVAIRELVSNAVDATQKLKAVKMAGEEVPEFNDEDLKIWVDVDEENGIVTISDQGVGMTEEEIDKYINQVAYSGINDFIEKYKDHANDIIGHFGLGFYSAFTLAKKVEIVTKSYKTGSKFIKWSCDGTVDYTIEELPEDTERKHGTWGTDIILYLSDEDKEEYGKKNRIKEILNKYSKFVPVTLIFGKKQKWDSSLGKQVDTDEDLVINDIEPIWNKRPSELKDEDYKEFFRKMFPGESEPVFWIHLNAEEPFMLRGILFFPSSFGKNFVTHKRKIHLYTRNVFVTDDTSTIDVTDDFMQMLFGVIDTDALPLNVSRSYLQGNNDIKKVKNYINRKVASKLCEILKEDRKRYEELWKDLKVVVNYGILSVDDFYDKVKDAYLFKDTDDKYFTLEEYKTLIEANQKDKNDQLVYLYTTDKNVQATYIQAAKNKGYSVLEMNEESLDLLGLDVLERKLEKTHFARVDSDTINKLIKKDDETAVELAQEDKDLLREVFQGTLNELQSIGNFAVNTENLGEDELPCTICQSEWSRRMKDNSKFQTQSWYGQMPDSFTINLNSEHELIKQILEDAHTQTDEELKPLVEDIVAKKAELDAVNEELKDVAWENRTQEQRDKLSEAEKAHMDAINKKSEVLKNYGKNNEVVAQLIDIALLGNGLLRGEKLAEFLKRSVTFIKK